MASSPSSNRSPSSADAGLEPLPARLETGRVFTAQRRVRLGDVSPRGRLRFDALTRYTQDVSNDDTTDAEMSDVPGWVVRSTVVDEIRPAVFDETLRFTTFCAGVAQRWADRRLSVVGDGGGHYEISTLWVCVDHTTGRPVPLTDQFLSIYGEAAGGRSASARQRNPKRSRVADGQRRVEQWQLRKVDFDTLGHVNNAAYWAAVEQWLGEGPGSPRRARMEYGQGIDPAPSLPIERAVLDDGTMALWWLQGDGVAATASVVALDPALYTGPSDRRRYTRPV